MIPMKASEIADFIGGTLLGDDIEVHSHAFLSSLQCTPGSIFLAIKGEKVDGHDFVTDAFAHGAVLAITSKSVSERCIVVDDVTLAIGKLAHHLRTQLKHLKVIGITGSQGKTTTKEFLREILSTEGETISPAGNNNNDLGVPLTLLQCTNLTKYCILEMGARHLGDIARLAQIAIPDVGVVLKVAAAHLGEFGSIENIAETKSEMISALSLDGIAILGQYDPHTQAMSKLHDGKVVRFGETTSAEIRATDIELRDGCAHFELVTPSGRATTTLRVIGEHQVANALAAAAVAYSLGVSVERIAAALSMAELKAKWRMELHDLDDLTLINDSYNASPDSMAAALRTLVHISQERGGESWAFLGNMRELGESSPREHALIAELAESLGVDHLVTIGTSEYAAGISPNSQTTLHQCQTKEEAGEFFQFFNRGDVVLCKASRSDGLEVVADEIINFWSKRVKEKEVTE